MHTHPFFLTFYRDHNIEQGFGPNSTLFASVYALDALGAASRATFGVSVSAFEGSVGDLSTLVDDVATEALVAGDTDTVMQVGPKWVLLRLGMQLTPVLHHGLTLADAIIC